MASEVEVRTFITNEDYDRLLRFFKENAEYRGRREEETLYFDCDHDIRLRRTGDEVKVMFKKGETHDEIREGFEVNISPEHFDTMLEIFQGFGWNISIKWKRRREVFSWKGFRVLVDDSEGYGKILEIGKKDAKDKEKTLEQIKELLKELKVPETLKDTFRQKYEWYSRNWQRLLSE